MLNARLLKASAEYVWEFNGAYDNALRFAYGAKGIFEELEVLDGDYESVVGFIKALENLG